MQNKNLSRQDIRRFLENVYTREEAERIFRNIYNNEYGDILLKSMDDVWEEAANQPVNMFQKNAYMEEAAALLRKINQKPSIIRRYFKRSLSIAASIAVLLTLSVGIYKFAAHREPVYSDITTTFGETKTLRLPDGTVVNLNACSSIRFPDRFDDDERRIGLEGEAYFQVNRNEEQAFVITTGKFDVKVLGTEFNVKAYAADEIQSVDVKQGKVQVEMPEATIRLTASEQLRMNMLSDEYGKYREEHPVASWERGYLYFDKTPIRDVANELERIYHCKIEFEPGHPFNNLISGEHANKNIQSVLKSIEYTSGIHFRYDEKSKQIMFYK
jgi:ferric-dicitrate binding protein FerR (iron transport regulator)